jgi:hypothetical protein
VKKSTIIAAILVLAVAGAALYLRSRAKPAPKAASLLPETTLLYVAVPDFPKSRQRFQQTQLCALWQEPEVQAFLERPGAALREALGAAPSDSVLGQILEARALGLLQGEVFLAVTHITPNFGVVVGADVRGKQIEARAFLKAAEHDLARQFPGATASEKRYLGVDYEVWHLTGRSDVCHAFLNSLLIITPDEDLLRDLITRFTGQAATQTRTLSASDAFQNALRHTPAGHEAVAFLNVRPLLGFVGPLLALAPQSGGAIQSLANIESTAATMTFTDGLVEDTGLIAYAGTNHVPVPPVERRTLALTSPDTSWYAVQSVNLAAFYRTAMDSVVLSGNATLTSAASRFDGELRRRGLRFDEDVLEHLGPELAWIGAWREGARWPDVALVAEVREAGALRPKLDAAMDAVVTSRTWETQTYLGETLRTRTGEASPVAPTYVVTEKFLVVASNADYARALVAQSKGNAPTLVGNASFTGALGRVPASAASFTYCDAPRVLAALYTLARANAAANPFLEFDKLPKTETLTKHFAPYVSATVDTPSLQITTTFSTLGKPLTLAVGVAGALAAAQPWLAELPVDVIPAWPRMSSGNPPAGNRTAPSQTPAP